MAGAKVKMPEGAMFFARRPRLPCGHPLPQRAHSSLGASPQHRPEFPPTLATNALALSDDSHPQLRDLHAFASSQFLPRR